MMGGAPSAFAAWQMMDGVTAEDDKVNPVRLQESCELLHASNTNMVMEIADFVPSASTSNPRHQAEGESWDPALPCASFNSFVHGISNFLVVQ